MRLLFLVAITLPALLAGCASGPRPVLSAGPQSTCHVCRYNNDLACIDVNVTTRTPRMEYRGETYYFCSQDCLQRFTKNPTKYLPK